MFIIKSSCGFSISIHALRGEGDLNNLGTRFSPPVFQSTPSVGRATYMVLFYMIVGIFQSTPSVGRATILSPKKSMTLFTFQSTPSVGRATRLIRADIAADKISIHALRGEGDDYFGFVRSCKCISIHALRGEGDVVIAQKVGDGTYFNPRPPWGGRHLDKDMDVSINTISIHALRGEGDVQKAHARQPFHISIHALRGEGDAIWRL